MNLYENVNWTRVALRIGVPLMIVVASTCARAVNAIIPSAHAAHPPHAAHEPTHAMVERQMHDAIHGAYGCIAILDGVEANDRLWESSDHVPPYDATVGQAAVCASHRASIGGRPVPFPALVPAIDAVLGAQRVYTEAWSAARAHQYGDEANETLGQWGRASLTLDDAAAQLIVAAERAQISRTAVWLRELEGQPDRVVQRRFLLALAASYRFMIVSHTEIGVRAWTPAELREIAAAARNVERTTAVLPQALAGWPASSSEMRALPFVLRYAVTTRSMAQCLSGGTQTAHACGADELIADVNAVSDALDGWRF